MDLPMHDPKEVSARSYGAAVRWRRGLTERVGRVRLASRVVLVGLLISFAGILWLNQMSTIVSLGYDMENIDKKVALLNRQAEALQSQIANFENLQRIENEAKGRLGMVSATKFVYVKVAQNEGQATPSPTNPKLYPVNDWWRQLTEMLPRPWQDSAPSQK